MVFLILLFWTLMSTKLWSFSCFLIRNMFGLLVVYFTHLVPHVNFSRFVYALHIATSCTHFCQPCHVLVYILFPHPQHVMFYFMLCCIVFLRCFVFCLTFIFSIILHPSCIIILVHIFFFFPSFLLIHLSISDKKGESILECIVISYNSCAHSQREKFYLVHICRGRNSIEEMHILRGRRHLL